MVVKVDTVVVSISLARDHPCMGISEVVTSITCPYSSIGGFSILINLTSFGKYLPMVGVANYLAKTVYLGSIFVTTYRH